jgi:hypothetical protein
VVAGPIGLWYVFTAVQTQEAWTRNQIATNTSDFWTGVGLLMSQFDGLMVCSINEYAHVILQL